MSTQITPRDWESLSAYLDEQLSASDRQNLENRLAKNPDLRRALDELHSTRSILRSLPKLRAPRNFTLTPSMAGQKARAGAPASAYPVLRLASMLATLFFIIVTAGGLVLRFNLPAQTVVMRSDQSQNAPAAPAFGMGGGGGAASSNIQAPQAPALPTEAAAANALESAPAQTGPASLQVTPLAPESTPGEAPQAPMPKALSVVQGSPEAQPPNAQAPQDMFQKRPAPAAQPFARGAWTLLTVLQVLLALLAVVSGVAALYLRRLGRH